MIRAEIEKVRAGLQDQRHRKAGFRIFPIVICQRSHLCCARAVPPTRRGRENGFRRFRVAAGRACAYGTDQSGREAAILPVSRKGRADEDRCLIRHRKRNAMRREDVDRKGIMGMSPVGYPVAASDIAQTCRPRCANPQRGQAAQGEAKRFNGKKDAYRRHSFGGDPSGCGGRKQGRGIRL